ncbi:MAG: dihydrofolate reductase [Candidatus Omnitrophica bacterium]|nr:dihydrofolate reductase [Candidatus Omnitrophota bacterium]
MISFSIIVAVDSKLGIGKNGVLPWHLPADLKHFKEITSSESSDKRRNVVVMGRKTWESIPEKFRPLANRLNVVISRQTHLILPAGVVQATSLEGALNFLCDTQRVPVGEVFVIGGAQIFAEAVNHPACEKIYVTRIEREFVCDTFFPDVLQQFTQVGQSEVLSDQGVAISFLKYQKKAS